MVYKGDHNSFSIGALVIIRVLRISVAVLGYTCKKELHGVILQITRDAPAKRSLGNLSKPARTLKQKAVELHEALPKP